MCNVYYIGPRKVGNKNCQLPFSTHREIYPRLRPFIRTALFNRFVKANTRPIQSFFEDFFLNFEVQRMSLVALAQVAFTAVVTPLLELVSLSERRDWLT